MLLIVLPCCFLLQTLVVCSLRHCSCGFPSPSLPLNTVSSSWSTWQEWASAGDGPSCRRWSKVAMQWACADEGQKESHACTWSCSGRSHEGAGHAGPLWCGWETGYRWHEPSDLLGHADRVWVKTRISGPAKKSLKRIKGFGPNNKNKL